MLPQHLTGPVARSFEMSMAPGIPPTHTQPPPTPLSPPTAAVRADQSRTQYRVTDTPVTHPRRIASRSNAYTGPSFARTVAGVRPPRTAENP